MTARPDSATRFFTGLAAATRMLRADADLSQHEVAERGRLSPRFVSDVEHERANPRYRQLDQLAHGLGLAGGAPQLVTLAVEAADRIEAATIRPSD